MGISRRAFAKSRNISEAAVRAHIASGVLADAVLPDKTIDAKTADRLIARTLTRSKGKVPVVLSAARQRRARAVVRDLLDDAGDLRRSLINPHDAERLMNRSVDEVAVIARRWPGQVAVSVAGRPPDEVQRLLKARVNDLLQEMHDAKSTENGGTGDAPAEPDLGGMSPVELAAVTEHLRAEILEMQRLERQRRLVRVDDAHGVFVAALSLAKSILQAIPGRAAQLIALSDVAEAERLLAVEVEGFCLAAHIDLSPLTEGARP